MLRRVARGVDISSEQKNSFKGRREQDFGRFIYKEISGCKHEWAKCINIKSFKCCIIVFFSLWWLKLWYCMYSRFVVSDSLQPVDCGLPGSSVHGIFLARILEWVVTPFSRGYSQPRDGTCVSCTASRFFTSECLWNPGDGIRAKINIYHVPTVVIV